MDGGYKIIKNFKENKIDIKGLLKERDKDTQRQMEDGNIRETRYNRKYKQTESDINGPKYLTEGNIDKLSIENEIRAMTIRTR